MACADPTNVLALDDVGCTPDVRTSWSWSLPRGRSAREIARTWSLSADSADVALLMEDVDVEQVDDRTGRAEADEAPTVRLVSIFRTDAVRGRAGGVGMSSRSPKACTSGTAWTGCSGT